MRAGTWSNSNEACMPSLTVHSMIKAFDSIQWIVNCWWHGVVFLKVENSSTHTCFRCAANACLAKHPKQRHRFWPFSEHSVRKIPQSVCAVHLVQFFAFLRIMGLLLHLIKSLSPRTKYKKKLLHVTLRCFPHSQQKNRRETGPVVRHQIRRPRDCSLLRLALPSWYNVELIVTLQFHTAPNAP